VTDHPTVLAVGLGTPEIAGAEVDTADDLLGALATLADGGVDVVLLSLDLGDTSGAEAIRSIRERAPAVPVIGLGGEEAERAIDAGASDVLPADAPPALVERAIRYATDLQRLQAELHRRQVVDDLTGLYNARGFEQLASHHLALADRSKRPVVLVFVRLEGGEGTPDRADLVAETATILRDAVRGSDVIARVGDGSFCVLLTGDAAGSESVVLSRLVEAVAATNANGRATQLSLSVGKAAYDPDHPVPLGDLIAEADRAMRRGR
jgi:diguanylate cyclase (GGDEF)-like protein